MSAVDSLAARHLPLESGRVGAGDCLSIQPGLLAQEGKAEGNVSEVKVKQEWVLLTGPSGAHVGFDEEGEERRWRRGKG